MSGGNNWTPPAPQPSAKAGLTHEDRDRLRKQNAWAADIIAKFGDKGEAPETEQSILDGRLKSSRTTNQGWMPGTQKWDLKHQYPGFSDGDIALLESTRRNVARAKAAMAQAGKLSKSQVTALQLRGMGVLADATMNLALALAPYGSASALVTRSLLGAPTSVIDAGVSEAVGSAAGEIGQKPKVTDGAIADEGEAAKKALRKGDVTTYQDFVDRSVVGDNLEGHEIWQHANLNEQGLAAARLSTPASQKNPVIVLDKAVHSAVHAEQPVSEARAMTPVKNITTNAQTLRNLNAAPPEAVDAAEKAALEHAGDYGY